MLFQLTEVFLNILCCPAKHKKVVLVRLVILLCLHPAGIISDYHREFLGWHTCSHVFDGPFVLLLDPRFTVTSVVVCSNYIFCGWEKKLSFCCCFCCGSQQLRKVTTHHFFSRFIVLLITMS